MHGRGVSRRGLIWLTGALVVVLAVWNNLVVTRLPGYPASYVVVNMAAAGALLAAARWAGLTWEELGLARRRLPAGLAWGGVCVATIAAAYVVALVVPALRPLLTDARVGGMDGAEITYQTLVRVPFGTVLWEEIAFRGVLLAALIRLYSVRVATVASCALFGIWHIRPTLSAVAANDFVTGPSPPARSSWWPVWRRRRPASSSPCSACAAAASSLPSCSTWRPTRSARWPPLTAIQLQ